MTTSQVPQNVKNSQRQRISVRAAWRIFLCRQAVHGGNPETGFVSHVAWRVVCDRQVVSGKIPKT